MSADGPMNLYDAVTVATAECAFGQGVLAVLDNRIRGARDVRKSCTSGAADFSSGENGALGKVQDGRVVFNHRALQPHTGKSVFKIEDGLSPVEIIICYGGVSFAALDCVLSAGTKGIVVAGALPDGIAQPDRKAVPCRATRRMTRWASSRQDRLAPIRRVSC
jgi:L-asparaginase